MPSYTISLATQKGEVMEKTLHIHKMELLEQIKDRILQEQVGHNIYGTTNEDAFLSGINEGLSRAVDALKDFEE